MRTPTEQINRILNLQDMAEAEKEMKAVESQARFNPDLTDDLRFMVIAQDDDYDRCRYSHSLSAM